MGIVTSEESVAIITTNIKHIILICFIYHIGPSFAAGGCSTEED